MKQNKTKQNKDLRGTAGILEGGREKTRLFHLESNMPSQLFESEKVELKRELTKDFAREVVAFLNSGEGRIYVGVEDDGKVVGVDDSDTVIRKIRDIVRDQIAPSTLGKVSICLLYDEEGHKVPFLDVRGGDDLYYLKEYGHSSRGCFLRDGTSAVSMGDDEIKRRWHYHNDPVYDLAEDPLNQDGLTFLRLFDTASARGIHLNADTFMDNLRFRTREGKVNKLAMLFSDQSGASIRFGRFPGVDKRVISECADFGHRCLFAIIDGLLERLLDLNASHCFIDHARQRLEFSRYSMEAVTEILVNAFAHNDYSIDYPRVLLFRDRLEITSMGGLPKGQTKEGFLAGLSVRRNPALVDVLSMFRYAEKTGHGMEKILHEYPSSIFDIGENYVTARIPFRFLEGRDMEEVVDTSSRASSFVTKDDPSFLDYLKENPHARLDEIARRLSLSRGQAQRYLSRSERIRHVGPTRGGYWEVID